MNKGIAKAVDEKIGKLIKTIKDKNKEPLWLLLISFISAFACLYPYRRIYGFNNSDFLSIELLIWAAVFGLLRWGLFVKEPLIEKKRTWSLSGFFSFCIVTGIYFTGEFSFERMKIRDFFAYAFCVLFSIPVWKCIIGGWFRFLNYLKKKSETNAKDNRILFPKMQVGKKTDIISCLIVALFIFACWTVVWLAYYPGFLNFDPVGIRMVRTGKFDTQHPLIHDLFLGYLFQLGTEVYHDPKGGLIFNCFAQMIIGTFVLTYIYSWVRHRVQLPLFRLFYVFYAALFPANAFLALSTAKDTVFSYLFALSTVLSTGIVDLIYQMKSGTAANNKPLMRKKIILFISIVLMMLWRNNAPYAVILVIIWLFLKRKKFRILNYKKSLLFLFVALGCFLLINSGLKKILHAESGPLGEAYSVIDAEFARIYYYTDDEKAKDIIRQHINIEGRYYEPYCIDTIKGGTINLDQKSDLLPLYRDAVFLFFRHPIISIDSFIYLTKGNWDINDRTHASIYSEGPGRMGYIMHNIQEVDGTGTPYQIKEDSKIPWLKSIYDKIISENCYQQVLFLPVIFSLATYFWIMLFASASLRSKGDYDNLFSVQLGIGLFITILLGPCAYARYTYPFMCCWPVYIVLIISAKDQRENALLEKDQKSFL